MSGKKTMQQELPIKKWISHEVLFHTALTIYTVAGTADPYQVLLLHQRMFNSANNFLHTTTCEYQ